MAGRLSGGGFGPIAVEMELQNKKFKKELTEVEKRTKRWEKRTQQSAAKVKAAYAGVATRVGGLKAAVGALAGVLALGFLAKASRSAIEFGDNIAKTADRIGIGVEALQELQFVATQSGVDISTLDSSIGAFTKRVGEARAGVGPLTAQLRQTNPALLELLRTATSTEEAFSIMIEAIAGAGTELDQAALASAAFSRAGLALVNIARQGADSINALRQEARDAGFVLREELIRETETLNDEFDLLSRQSGAEFKRLLIDLAPTVNAVASGLVLVVQGIQGVLGGFKEAKDLSDQVLGVQLGDAQFAVAGRQAGLDRLLEPTTLRDRVKVLFTLGLAEDSLSEAIMRRDSLQTEVDRRQKQRDIQTEISVKQASAVLKLEEQKALLAEASKVEAKQAAALKQLTAARIADEIVLAGSIDSRLGEIAAIEQTIIKLQALELSEEGELERVLALTRARNQLNQIRQNIATDRALAALPPGPAQQLATQQGELSRFGADATGVAQFAPGDDEDLIEPERIDEFGQRFGDVVAGSLSGAIGDALSGDGIDFLQTFADAGGQFLQDGLSSVLDELSSQVGDLFSGLGEGLGAALGVGLGIGAKILQGALKGTQSSGRDFSIRSAVTSTQQVRGVAAGPINVAVAQVGGQIDDAFVPGRALQRIEIGLLTEMRNALNQILSGGGAGFSVGLTLESSGALG